MGTCRSKSQGPAAAIWEASSAVSCLSWEEPWLAASYLDGSLLLLDLEACVRAGSQQAARLGAPLQRPRQFPGQGGSAFCVHLCDQWMACGSGLPSSSFCWPSRAPSSCSVRALASKCA